MTGVQTCALPILRTLTLQILSENRGVAPDFNSFVACATWLLPSKRAGGLPADYIAWTLREAEWLGITGQGAISTYGADFLSGEIVSRLMPIFQKPLTIS